MEVYASAPDSGASHPPSGTCTLRPQGLELGGWGLQTMWQSLSLTSKEELRAEPLFLSPPGVCVTSARVHFPLAPHGDWFRRCVLIPALPRRTQGREGDHRLGQGLSHVLTGPDASDPLLSLIPPSPLGI